MKKVDLRHFGRFLMPNSLSSRGDDLYFCIRRADFDDNDYKTDLWRLRGGCLRQLTSTGDVGSYRLLDEGVVFSRISSKKDGEKAKSGVPLTVLQLLPYDGGEALELCRLGYNVAGMSFMSRDRFVFTASCSAAWDAALEKSGGDAEKAAALLKEDADYQVLDEVPFCSNGAGYTNGQRSRLFLWDKGEVKPLTGPDFSCWLAGASADRRRVAVIGAEVRGLPVIYDRLYELDTETLELTDMSVSDACSHYGAMYDPDGGLVALAATYERIGLSENPRVFTRWDGGWKQVYGDGRDLYGSVGSDIKAGGEGEGCPIRGGGLYLTDTVWGDCHLVRLDLKTGDVTEVTRESGNVCEFCLTPDGFAVIALRGGLGCEVYSVTESGEETRLTELNTALSAEYEYSEPKPLSFVNSQGDEIAGWVIEPVGREEGKKYPAILDVHGGPKTAYGSCYFHEMQLWASEGYAVMFCNPTGSSGRGNAFADLRGRYGQQDYRDLMAFTDLVLEKYDYIDRERLGVTGGSYGGFMTNWIIGHTDRFRAAASQRSISNWVSFYGMSDIGPYFAIDQVAATPWENAGRMWDQSPLKYADRVTTPTLFIHSDEDYRCPLEQGVQMFNALRVRGVETRLCMFRGENHELSRSGKPRHRERRLREITEWFNSRLK